MLAYSQSLDSLWSFILSFLKFVFAPMYASLRPLIIIFMLTQSWEVVGLKVTGSKAGVWTSPQTDIWWLSEHPVALLFQPSNTLQTVLSSGPHVSIFLHKGPGTLVECPSKIRILTGQSSPWDLSIAKHILNTVFLWTHPRILLKSRHVIHLKISSRMYSLLLFENQNSSCSVSVFRDVLPAPRFIEDHQRSLYKKLQAVLPPRLCLTWIQGAVFT